MRHVDPALFPNVVGALRRAGIDPEHELVPVAPAAHYMMGGIAVDLDAQASLPGLFAVGECSCTGLHGANRLASNSLSECFVFGARAARAALATPGSALAPDAAARLPTQVGPPPRLTDASREALWRYAGLVRDPTGCSRLLDGPAPARPSDRGVRARAPGEPRRAPATDFPDRDPALDNRHVVTRDDGPPAIVEWT